MIDPGQKIWSNGAIARATGQHTMGVGFVASGKPRVVDMKALKVACQTCSLYELCLPLGLENKDLDELDRIVKRQRPLQRGNYLFHVGDPFKSVYAIRTGSVKTYTCNDEGDEQVTGFHLPGELVGLDAITSGRHPCAARALETTSLCEIPFSRLEELSSHIPGLQRQLLRLMSREILEEQNMMVWLGKKTAEQRLALLLLRIARNQHERHFSPYEFNLSMSRTDIGNYLGLAVETISRLFSRFQQDGILTVERKHVVIQDMDRLRQIAHPDDCPLDTGKVLC